MLLRFDGFELDTVALELCRDGEILPLAPQPTKVLAFLAENAGRTVSREELQGHVWGDGHVEADLGLNSCIRKIRAQLGDDAGEPRFIRTLPRRGYRFVADLESVPEADPEGKTVSSTAGQWRWVAILVVAAGLLGWALLARGRDGSEPPPPTGSGPIALAVLPFENLTSDPAQDYIAAGLTEETIARLGQVEPERLAVIARTTAMQLGQEGRDLTGIARDLEVSHLIEGSVRRENGRLRITVGLIDGASGLQSRSEIFEVPSRDVLAAQASLADSVAGWLTEHLLTENDSLVASNPELESDLYETYLQGLHHLQQGTSEDYQTARHRFATTVEGAPDFALGWAGLAEAELWLRWFGSERPDESLEAARAAANRAIELAPELGAPHLLLAYAALYVDYDFEESGRRFARAVELEPGTARGQSWYAGYLSATGAHEQALARARLARRLDPLAMAVRADLCWLHNYAREFEGALGACDNALELKPGDGWTTLGKLEALRQLGRHAEAVAILEQLAAGSANEPEAETWTELAAREPTAALDRALEWLETAASQRSQPYFTASIAALRGRNGQALEMLDEAWRTRDLMLVFVGVDPRFDSVRSSPRFQDLVTRLGLAGVSSKAG